MEEQISEADKIRVVLFHWVSLQAFEWLAAYVDVLLNLPILCVEGNTCHGSHPVFVQVSQV